MQAVSARDGRQQVAERLDAQPADAACAGDELSLVRQQDGLVDSAGARVDLLVQSGHDAPRVGPVPAVGAAAAPAGHLGGGAEAQHARLGDEVVVDPNNDLARVVGFRLDEQSLLGELVPFVDDVPEVGAAFTAGVVEALDDISAGALSELMQLVKLLIRIFGVYDDARLKGGQQACVFE